MSELDLLNLARSCGQTISNDFAQVITITSAMIVAIYYFLHQAGIRMKVFAFAVYTCGMLLYLGMMVLESGVAIGAQNALKAIPTANQAAATQIFLGMRAIWLGTGYLLFFWCKPEQSTRER